MENQLCYLQTNSYESWMMMNDFVGFDKSEEKKIFHEVFSKINISNSKITPYFIGGQNDKNGSTGVEIYACYKTPISS